MKDMESLREIVNSTIKNVRCSECGKYPITYLNKRVEFKIECPKNNNCSNYKSLEIMFLSCLENFSNQY